MEYNSHAPIITPSTVQMMDRGLPTVLTACSLVRISADAMIIAATIMLNARRFAIVPSLRKGRSACCSSRRIQRLARLPKPSAAVA